MVSVHTFVSEHLAHFVYSVESSDDESLQEKLVGNTKLHVDVQRVVMCIERSCVCSACDCCEDWSIYFQISVVFFQNSLDFLNDS